MRNDIHKPSLLDPAEYVYVAAFYQGDSHWLARAYQAEMEEYEQALEEFQVFDGNHARKGTCDHCGAAFNHGVLFYHVVTTELVHIGHICAANTVGLPDKAAAARKRAERQAEEMKEQDERKQAGEGWRTENADLVTWLENLPDGSHGFLVDMRFSLNKWGKLTERQTTAARNWKVRDEERAERKARDEQERQERFGEIPALEEGRYTMTGRILNVKWQTGDYGTQLKMLVELQDGNRVWGTCPQAVVGFFTDEADMLKGQSITFTGTVKPKQDDPHFGYFSRPAGAKVLPS
jgi:hypothetical protein